MRIIAIIIVLILLLIGGVILIAVLAGKKKDVVIPPKVPPKEKPEIDGTVAGNILPVDIDSYSIMQSYFKATSRTWRPPTDAENFISNNQTDANIRSSLNTVNMHHVLEGLYILLCRGKVTFEERAFLGSLLDLRVTGRIKDYEQMKAYLSATQRTWRAPEEGEVPPTNPVASREIALEIINGFHASWIEDRTKLDFAERMARLLLDLLVSGPLNGTQKMMFSEVLQYLT